MLKCGCFEMIFSATHIHVLYVPYRPALARQRGGDYTPLCLEHSKLGLCSISDLLESNSLYKVLLEAK